jgi:serine O-acetyltransferase
VNYSELSYLVKSDLYRHGSECSIYAFWRNFRLVPGFRYSVIMRLCRYTGGQPALRYTIAPLLSIMHRRYTIKYGISISPDTKIGSGFYIGHFGGVVINTDAVIGKNCNISQEVTIGQTNRGKRQGCPVIGDNVYIGPGAKIIGRIVIGDNVAIGANCVVTKDMPDNAVVVGIPGKVISYEGSAGYINRTDYG